MTVTRCLCVLITLLLASSQSKGGNFGRSEDRYNPQHIETSVHSVFGYGLGWSTKMCQPNMREFYTTTLPSLSVRIDLDTDSRIGPGKIQLLENIRACGSISGAGRAMDMSYKRAWALVDEMNRICGRAAVERMFTAAAAADTLQDLLNRAQ